MTGPGPDQTPPGLDDPSGSPRLDGLRLYDLAGLILGYALAAFLVRSAWREIIPRTPLEIAGIAVLFAWAGLAMSGPFVLLLDRRNAPAPSPVPTTDATSRFAGEEFAWLGIGAYFIALTVFVAPAREDHPPWGLNLAIQAVGAAFLVLWLRADRRERAMSPRDDSPEPPRWTRPAARAVLLTWPIAWGTLVWLLW